MANTCPTCKNSIPPDGECFSHSCRYFRALSNGELILGPTPNLGKLVVQSKYDQLFKQSDTSFFAKDAAKLAGTTKRNAQYFTDQNLVVPDMAGNPGKGKTGQGRARKYSLLNCIELAVVSRMAKDGISHAVIRMAMLAIGGWRNHIFAVDDAYLLLYRDDQFPDTAKVQVWWNLTSWDEVLGGGAPFNYDKVYIVNLTKARDEVLARMT
jgi:hypothetical protein